MPAKAQWSRRFFRMEVDPFERHRSLFIFRDNQAGIRPAIIGVRGAKLLQQRNGFRVNNGVRKWPVGHVGNCILILGNRLRIGSMVDQESD